MDIHPHPDGEVNELERRLGAWQPNSDGLDTAAMLFAAGQASARPGRARFIWPLLCGSLAVVAASLGTWAMSERTERLALAHQVQQAPRPAAPTPVVPTPPPASAEPSEPDPAVPLVREDPPAHSFLAYHHMLNKGLDAWPPAASVPPKSLPESPPPPVFRAWPYGELMEP